MKPEERFELLIQDFLRDMAAVKCTQAEYLEALRAALGEVEVSIQACKETM